MPIQWRFRSGAITEANTETNLRNVGGTAATGQPSIPNGVSVLDILIVNGITAGGDGSSLLLVGVNGTGINADEKPVLFPVVGSQAATTAGQVVGPRSTILKGLQISVNPSQFYDYVGIMFGDDQTNADIGVAGGFI